MLALALYDVIKHTSDTAVVILFPPEAPITSCTLPSSLVKMAGDMDEKGLLFGSGKLKGDGNIPSTMCRNVKIIHLVVVDDSCDVRSISGSKSAKKQR